MTWLYQSQLVETLPEDCVGFVYLITNNLSGRKYIGKKLRRDTARLTALRLAEHVAHTTDVDGMLEQMTAATTSIATIVNTPKVKYIVSILIFLSCFYVKEPPFCDPDWTRTNDRQLRRLLLYPTELRDQMQLLPIKGQ